MVVRPPSRRVRGNFNPWRARAALLRPADPRYPTLMPSLDDIRTALLAAEQAGDLDAADAQRQAFLELAPDGEERVEVQYRLGLSRLFRHHDTDGALEHFKEAAAHKTAPLAPQARISYALALLAKQKRQQAIFELRRLLPAGATPSVHTAQALDFLSLLLRESFAPAADIVRVDAQRLEHLEALAQASDDPAQRAQYTLRLGAAFADGGSAQDLARARACFHEVLKLGPTAGAAALAVAQAQLKALPR